MKYNVIFWELDMNLAKSMDSFLSKEIYKLDGQFPGLIYNKTKKNIPNSNRFVIRCANGDRIDVVLSCYHVQDENEAVRNSCIIKNKDKYSKVLSVVNIGSTYFKAFHEHDLISEGIDLYPQDFKVDQIIIDNLEEDGISVLLTNCIQNFKYSKPEYMLDRVVVYDKVDSVWPALDRSKHIDVLLSHKDDIDSNLFNVLYFLLTSSIVNSQMFGEVIYKAVFPEYWKEYESDTKETSDIKASASSVSFTAPGNVNIIDEINRFGLFSNNADENIQSEERPDVESLIYENNNDRKRRK